MMLQLIEHIENSPLETIIYSLRPILLLLLLRMQRLQNICSLYAYNFRRLILRNFYRSYSKCKYQTEYEVSGKNKTISNMRMTVILSIAIA